MTDLNVRAAQLRLYGLVTALLLAIVIALAITAGAFAVSFAVQRDLAHMAMLPPDLTWIIPAIVDTAIFGATIGVVVLSKIDGSAGGRWFFISLAIAVILVSVWSNGYHAYRAAEEAHHEVATGADLGFSPLNPVLAAGISVIPPILVLAWTHGIGLLIKAIGDAYTEHRALISSITSTDLAMPESITSDVATVASASADMTAPPSAVREAAEAIVADYPTGSVADRVTASAEPTSLIDHVAPGLALCEVIAPDVASGVASVEVVASDVAAVASDGPEQTIGALLAFIAQADLEPEVKTTARMKIEEKLTFAAIAERTGKVATSTALRRYQKAERVARAAGFTVPPLPDLETNADSGSDLAKTRQLATSR
ncbi:hypothetical protein GCM10023094_00570 [Rhodococcus olei]|uniref:Phage excisionase n=1 Tax=Rhodococcus olei TaxID=2161675 RepID=A0ABP8NQT3_9NOCA